MRWADMDLQGHVNNAVYVDYLQEARVDLMRQHGPSAASTGRAGLVVVRHDVTYVEPLTFRFRPVSIECWVTEIRAASFTMAYEVFHEDAHGRTVHLRATTVLSPFLFEEERPRRLTPEEKGALEPYLEPLPDWPRQADPDGPIGTVAETRLGHYPVHVRFSDVDVYGHVNNVKYFDYFMEARILLNARLLKQVPQEQRDVTMVVARTQVDYRAPILWRPEPYDAWTRLQRVGERSMVLDSQIRDRDRVLSSARVALVFVDPATGRATAPHPAYRSELERALESQAR